MACDELVAVETGFRFRNYAVHALDILKDFVRHGLGRQIARMHSLRGFTAGRKKAQVNDANSPPTLASPVAVATSPCGEAVFEILDRAEICEIEVVKHLESAPMAPGMAD